MTYISRSPDELLELYYRKVDSIYSSFFSFYSVIHSAISTLRTVQLVCSKGYFWKIEQNWRHFVIIRDSLIQPMKNPVFLIICDISINHLISCSQSLINATGKYGINMQKCLGIWRDTSLSLFSAFLVHFSPSSKCQFSCLFQLSSKFFLFLSWYHPINLLAGFSCSPSWFLFHYFFEPSHFFHST